MTQDQAIALIDYIQVMSERTNHQSVMKYLLYEVGLSEQELDGACRELAALAQPKGENL